MKNLLKEVYKIVNFYLKRPRPLIKVELILIIVKSGGSLGEAESMYSHRIFFFFSP